MTFAEAVRAVLPCPVRLGFQPEPERIPVDHGARCLAAGCQPDAWRRADVDVTFRTGRRLVFDVATVNVLSASGVSRFPSVARHVASIEATKRNAYLDYYRTFHPFVITLAGAASEESFRALRAVADEAAKTASSVLDWEPAHWVDAMMHRLAVSMVRTTALLVTSSRTSRVPVA